MARELREAKIALLWNRLLGIEMLDGRLIKTDYCNSSCSCCISPMSQSVAPSKVLIEWAQLALCLDTSDKNVLCEQAESYTSFVSYSNCCYRLLRLSWNSSSVGLLIQCSALLARSTTIFLLRFSEVVKRKRMGFTLRVSLYDGNYAWRREERKRD